MRFNKEGGRHGMGRQAMGRHGGCRHPAEHGECRRFARGRDDFDDHERGGRHRHGGGGRRGRRFFDHGELRLVILGLLAEKPRHGYELIKAIEDAAGGQYSPSPGVVYPTLTLLEEMNQAAIVDSEGSRKLFGVTDEGRAQIEANKGAVDALFARMAEAKAIHGDGPPPQIIRAMENLKMALRLKLAMGKPDEDQIRRAAAAIDAAALEIEKL